MSPQRTYVWSGVLQPCLHRRGRSGLTGLPLHTGTEHRCWSSAETGEGKDPVFRREGTLYSSQGAAVFVWILPHRWCRRYTKSQGGMRAFQRQIHLRLKTFYNLVTLNSEYKLAFSIILNPVATGSNVS